MRLPGCRYSFNRTRRTEQEDGDGLPIAPTWGQQLGPEGDQEAYRGTNEQQVREWVCCEQTEIACERTTSRSPRMNSISVTLFVVHDIGR